MKSTQEVSEMSDHLRPVGHFKCDIFWRGYFPISSSMFVNTIPGDTAVWRDTAGLTTGDLCLVYYMSVMQNMPHSLTGFVWSSLLSVRVLLSLFTTENQQLLLLPLTLTHYRHIITTPHTLLQHTTYNLYYLILPPTWWWIKINFFLCLPFLTYHFSTQFCIYLLTLNNLFQCHDQN